MQDNVPRERGPTAVGTWSRRGVLLLWVAVWASRLHGPIDLRWDASTYFVLGTALAEGKGYRLLNEPGEIEAVQYPPLLPVLVAAHQRALGTTDYLVVGARLRVTYFLCPALICSRPMPWRECCSSPHWPWSRWQARASRFTAISILPIRSTRRSRSLSLRCCFCCACGRSSRARASRRVASPPPPTSSARRASRCWPSGWRTASLRRRFGQAALRAALAALPVLAWQAHVARVTDSAAYHAPPYPYQRAPYYYANVTYGENSWLVSPFRPELGRTSPRDLGGTRRTQSAGAAAQHRRERLDRRRQRAVSARQGTAASACRLPAPPRELVLTAAGTLLAASEWARCSRRRLAAAQRASGCCRSVPGCPSAMICSRPGPTSSGAISRR